MRMWGNWKLWTLLLECKMVYIYSHCGKQYGFLPLNVFLQHFHFLLPSFKHGLPYLTCCSFGNTLPWQFPLVHWLTNHHYSLLSLFSFCALVYNHRILMPESKIPPVHLLPHPTHISIPTQNPYNYLPSFCWIVPNIILHILGAIQNISNSSAHGKFYYIKLELTSSNFQIDSSSGFRGLTEYPPPSILKSKSNALSLLLLRFSGTAWRFSSCSTGQVNISASSCPTNQNSHWTLQVNQGRH